MTDVLSDSSSILSDSFQNFEESIEVERLSAAQLKQLKSDVQTCLDDLLFHKIMNVEKVLNSYTIISLYN